MRPLGREADMVRAAHIAIYLAVAGLGTAMTFAPMLWLGQTQTDPGDTLLNHYILEHGWRCVSDPGYVGSFWSPPCFHPQPETLAYSENMIGVAPIYWLLRCGMSPAPAYQVWMITIVVLTFFAAVWSMRKFGATPLLAAAGAGAWAFGMPRINHLGHQQLQPAMFAPVALWCCWRLLQVPSGRRLAGLAAVCLAQLAASIYVGWFLALALGVLLVVAHCDADQRRRSVQFVRSEWPTVAGVTLVAGLAGYGLLAPYLRVNEGFRRSYRGEVRLMLPRLDSLLSPPPGSVWADWLAPTSGPLNHEHHVFPGITLYLLIGVVAAAGLARRRSIPPGSLWMLVGAAILLLLALRFGKASAWSAVYQLVPGAKGIRAVARMLIVIQLLAWMATLSAVAHWLADRRGWRTVLGCAVLAVGLAEQYQPRLAGFDRKPFDAEVARLAGELCAGGPAYIVPDPGCWYWVSHLAAMWAGLEANVPVVNGYSGRTPVGYPDEKLIWDDEELARWARGIRRVDSARLAAAYPAPLDPSTAIYRPQHMVRGNTCQISPTKPSPRPAPAPPGR